MERLCELHRMRNLRRQADNTAARLPLARNVAQRLMHRPHISVRASRRRRDADAASRSCAVAEMLADISVIYQ